MIPDPKSSTRVRDLRNLQKLSAVIALSVSTITMSGCSIMSDSTKDQGKVAICAAGDELVAQIKTGGAVGKFAAGVVRDNSTGDVKILAEKVASGQGDVQATEELGNYVETLCN